MGKEKLAVFVRVLGEECAECLFALAISEEFSHRFRRAYELHAVPYILRRRR